MGTTDRHAVELAVRQWQVIDAVLDNEIAVKITNGEESGTVDAARSIRAAGWDQAATSDGWPQVDRVVVITLEARQWRLVLTTLDRWARIAEPEDDSPSLDSIHAMVTAHLPDPATSVE